MEKNEFSFLASLNNNWTLYHDLIKEGLKKYYAEIENKKVNPRPSSEVIDHLLPFSLGEKNYPLEILIPHFMQSFGETLLHVDHPMYFGVFNPNPLLPAIVAEQMVTFFNPQLASSASAAYAIEIENRLIHYLGLKCGFPSDSIDGTFCSGGSEANLTAIWAALGLKSPQFFKKGVLEKGPSFKIYVSAGTHHSFQKMLPLLGLKESLVILPVTDKNSFSTEALEKQIQHDIEKGHLPLMIVGTLGTTDSGTIDPLKKLGEISKRYNIFFHIDAAFGGGAILLPELQKEIEGIELADSVTIDAHKWFSVPMTAGIFICRHPSLLSSLFDMGETSYMPHLMKKKEPYRESLSWSRRFQGFKLYLSLLVLGEEGYRFFFRHSIQNAHILREELKKYPLDYEIINETPLPVVCFLLKKIQDDSMVDQFVEHLNSAGDCFITTVKLPSKQKMAIRVGFPNFSTQKEHIYKLMDLILPY